MGDEKGGPARQHFGLRDVPGTTIAITSLAILGATALVTAPVWLWYRRKRKRTDRLAREAARAAEATKAAEAAGQAMKPEDETEGAGAGDRR